MFRWLLPASSVCCPVDGIADAVYDDVHEQKIREVQIESSL